MKELIRFNPQLNTNTIYVGLDISLNSTACVISYTNDKGIRCSDFKALSFSNQKYITNKIINETSSVRGGESDMILGCLDYHFIEYTDLPKTHTYSQAEYTHIMDYERISKEIVHIINKEILTIIGNNYNDTYSIQFNIEGYSQGLTPGKIIELVSFSYAIRNKLVCEFPDSVFVFVPPSTLKKYACYYTYGYVYKTKKPSHNPMNWVTRAPYGIAGGSFKKPDMLKALLASDRLNDNFHYMCKSYPDWLERSSIPKPIDDMVDAYWLSLYVVH
jgi:hypothetical protein